MHCRLRDWPNESKSGPVECRRIHAAGWFVRGTGAWVGVESAAEGVQLVDVVQVTDRLITV